MIMISIVLVIFMWVIKSIKIIGPKEMAVLVFLGKPITFCDSGIHFVPFLLSSLVKVPKKMYNLDYPAKEVITKEGTYKGVKYGVQVLKVDSVAYVNFPRDKNLIKIIESDVPTETEGLMDWTEEAVVGALRLVLGRKTWKEATEEIDEARKKTEEIFKKEDGALIKAGFKADGLRLTIKEIKLPKELEKALIKVDQERLKSDAASFVAKRQAKEWVGMVLESYAQVRGKSVEEVQKEIDTNEKIQREFLDYIKEVNIRFGEAERKALTDIRVEGGKSDSGGFIESLIKVVAAAKRIPEVGKEEKEEKEERKKPEEMEDEEYLQYLEEEQEKAE